MDSAMTLQHRGFEARVELDARRELLVGRFRAGRRVVRFEGTTIADLKQRFHAEVDTYVAACAREGVPVAKGYSGTFQVRIPADLHRRASEDARALGIPLTTRYVAAALEAYLKRRGR